MTPSRPRRTTVSTGFVSLLLGHMVEKKENNSLPETVPVSPERAQAFDDEPGEITFNLNKIPDKIKDNFDSFWSQAGVRDSEVKKALVVGCLGWETLRCPSIFKDSYWPRLPSMPPEEKAFAQEVLSRINTPEETRTFHEAISGLDSFLETPDGKKFRYDLDIDLGGAGQESKVTREFFSGLTEVIKKEKRSQKPFSWSALAWRPRAYLRDRKNVAGKYTPMNLENMISGADFISETEFKKGAEEFLKDPALKKIGEINPAWVWEGYRQENPEESKDEKKFFDNLRVTVARNLHFQEIPVTEATVKREMARIMEAREKFGTIPLFEGRNVLFLTHEEDRFNSPAHYDLTKQIEADGGKICGDSAELWKKGVTGNRIREKFLDLLENTTSPLTFIFVGHGSKYGMHLSGGDFISYAEFYRAYLNRRKKQMETGAGAEDLDIFITKGCHGADFVRNFMAYAKHGNKFRGIPIPIFISESEYGQYAYSEGGKYGDIFFENMFPENGEKARLKNIIDKDPENPHSNPSIYIPAGSGEIKQLSQNVDFLPKELKA